MRGGTACIYLTRFEISDLEIDGDKFPARCRRENCRKWVDFGIHVVIVKLIFVVSSVKWDQVFSCCSLTPYDTDLFHFGVSHQTQRQFPEQRVRSTRRGGIPHLFPPSLDFGGDADFVFCCLVASFLFCFGLCFPY